MTVDINASIIDQQLDRISGEIADNARITLKITDAERLKSLAFVFLCTKTILDLEHDAAFDCLTEGGNDSGIDAMHISGEVDGEFTVTLIQGKYDRSLEGDKNFPENGIVKLISSIGYLFNPNAELPALNLRIKAKVEEARSLIRDGLIPQVRVMTCNNGLIWSKRAQEVINQSDFGDQVTWEHVNHDSLIAILKRSKPVDETLSLAGASHIEDMKYIRVCVGRLPVDEIARMMEVHGDKLLERNVRRYLGLNKKGIRFL